MKGGVKQGVRKRGKHAGDERNPSIIGTRERGQRIPEKKREDEGGRIR